MKQYILFPVFFCLFLMGIFSGRESIGRQAHEEPVLYVYMWIGSIPDEVLTQFEAETGIKVICDFYDNNDFLEAKLMTGACAYDIVLPTAWPYMASQVSAGVYLPLDFQKIPNLKNLDPYLMESLSKADPGNAHAVPYTWGVTGIGYNASWFQRNYPEAPLDSLRMIFDADVLKRYAAAGVAMLDESIDVFPLALLYLGYDPNTTDTQAINHAAKHLESLRPYYDRFGAYQAANDLMIGEIVLTQGWSTEIFRAQSDKQSDATDTDEIRFTVPKEGSALWVDVLCIPRKARHPENAHKFLNFMLRPEIAAQCVNLCHSATAVLPAFPLIQTDIRNHPGIFPTEEVKKRLYAQGGLPTEIKHRFSRLWLEIKAGKSNVASRVKAHPKSKDQ